jgi:peptide/nickel transport system substrate-binding protein
MTLAIKQNPVNFDPINSEIMYTIDSGWLDRLFDNDWTLDPAVFDYKVQWRSGQYAGGQLAQSWEFTDPNTFVIHLRHGVHWQNISPANGREFTADDVVYHYDRSWGLGDGFTKVSPGHASVIEMVQDFISATATDKYTVVLKWKSPNPELIEEDIMQTTSSAECIENPDAVKLYGDVNDWHHAIGTGPFILKDFVSGSSATMVKNPDYYGYDERYPQNQLPYIDELHFLIIPDDATTLAGLRTGKIDLKDGVSLQDAQAMQRTNPEILQEIVPSTTFCIGPRVDKAPFTDVRVREALQLAIDLPTIAQTYYGGTCKPWPSGLTSNLLSGWGYPYPQWTSDLKAQYDYNPTKAKQLLADAGYPNGFNTNLVADAAVDLNMLQIIKSYFAAIGVNMSIQTMDSASWSAYVLTNHKNDALACHSGADVGGAYEAIRQFGRLTTGQASNYMMISDPTIDSFYTKAIACTDIDQVKQLLIDDNKYVDQQHYVICGLQPSLFGLCQPWIKGYNGQFYGATSANGIGVPMISFYQARFWIDQNLKKSLGH